MAENNQQTLGIQWELSVQCKWDTSLPRRPPKEQGEKGMTMGNSGRHMQGHREQRSVHGDKHRRVGKCGSRRARNGLSISKNAFPAAFFHLEKPSAVQPSWLPSSVSDDCCKCHHRLRKASSP